MVDIRDPVDILARTMFGEARGEGVRGMQAVANVVCNRAAHPRWWGTSIVAVCLHPWQFSTWDGGDPNRRAIEVVTETDPQFVDALALAREAVAGRLVDITCGADSYYAAGAPEPAWAEGKTPCAVIGRHRFYRVELGQPPVVARVLPTKPPMSQNAASSDAGKWDISGADALNAAELAQLGDIG